MEYKKGDIYPGATVITTATTVQPEEDDQQAITNNTTLTDVQVASGNMRNIFMAIALLIGISVLLGVVE